MATARDNLVADWRRQLHAAESALASSPERPWLARVRVRLYRFLLACYGKAAWRTSPPPPGPQSLIFDQIEAQFLHGKPARPAAKFQAVLKFVAGAQTPQPSGAVFAPHCYIAIAFDDSAANIMAIFAGLKGAGLAVRRVVRNGQDVVEVRGSDFYRACWLLRGYEAERTARASRIGDFGHDFMTNFGVALATAPFIGLLATLILGPLQLYRGREQIVAIVFCAVSIAWMTIFMAYRTAVTHLRCFLPRRARPKRPRVMADEDLDE